MTFLNVAKPLLVYNHVSHADFWRTVVTVGNSTGFHDSGYGHNKEAMKGAPERGGSEFIRLHCCWSASVVWGVFVPHAARGSGHLLRYDTLGQSTRQPASRLQAVSLSCSLPLLVQTRCRSQISTRRG